MVTDGNPTLNNTTSTSPSEVNWLDFTQAVTSANLLKSNDSRVITVAAGAAGSISIPGLVGISGPLTNQPSALDDDYIIGTPAELADALRDLALARCGASLDIEKQSVGGTATFDFTGTGAGLPATFTRNTAVANPTANAPFAFTAPQFGTKDVVETPEAGWTLTEHRLHRQRRRHHHRHRQRRRLRPGGHAPASIRATPPCGRSSTPATPRPARSRTPRPRSTSRSRAWAAPGPSTTPSTAPASRPSPGDTAVANPTTNAPFTFTAPQFGTKDVQETPVPAGWTLTNIVCTANGAVITIGTGIGARFAGARRRGFNAGDTTVRAVVDAGDTPTCTFTNTADASLDIEKQSVGGTATFDFGGTGAGLPATFTRDTAVANPTANAPFTFTAAQFGTKDVAGDARARLDAHEHRLRRQRRRHHHRHRQRRRLRLARRPPASTPGDTTVRAVIAAGNTPTCTFTNTLNASLDIEKQSVGGTATFDYAVNGAGLAHLHPRHRGRQPHGQRAVHLHRPPSSGPRTSRRRPSPAGR